LKVRQDMGMLIKIRNTRIPKAPGSSFPAGFTLIELLVSVVILAMGLAISLYLQIVSIKSGTQADNMTVASLLAESEIERLRAYPEFNQVPDGVIPVEHLTREGEGCAPGEERCLFTRTTNLTSMTPTTRSHTVKVTINWNDSLGPRNLSYDAVLTDYNLGNSN
jgi:prepilin-type N-terminal cleavage/methylation domain-containing protein